MAKHECPMDGCAKVVDDSLLACLTHWRMVPNELKGKVYATYQARLRAPNDAERKGQHLRACNEAVDAVNAKLAARAKPPAAEQGKLL